MSSKSETEDTSQIIPQGDNCGSYTPTDESQEEAKRHFQLSKHLETPYDINGRVCTHCGTYKEWSSFPVHKRSRVGRASLCMDCKLKDRRSKGRSIKREQLTAKNRNKKLKKDNPHLWRGRRIRGSLMHRANKLGMDREDIPTGDQICQWLLDQEPLSCYYTKTPVDIFKMHVDHKVPLSRGGTNTFDNLCVTDSKVNSAKGQMTDKEFEELLELMKGWEDGGKYVLMRLRQGFMGKR